MTMVVDIGLTVRDLDRSHGIRKANSKSKRRPTVVKINSYNDHREIFNNEKRLKLLVLPLPKA